MSRLPACATSDGKIRMSKIETTVFVLIGNNGGDYEQYRETVLGVFTHRADAELAGAEAKAFTDEYCSRWNVWCNSGGSRGPNRMPQWLDATRPYVPDFEVQEVPFNPATIREVELAPTCSVCGEPQRNTPSGMVCKNGHGGADAE